MQNSICFSFLCPFSICTGQKISFVVGYLCCWNYHLLVFQILSKWPSRPQTETNVWLTGGRDVKPTSTKGIFLLFKRFKYILRTHASKKGFTSQQCNVLYTYIKRWVSCHIPHRETLPSPHYQDACTLRQVKQLQLFHITVASGSVLLPHQVEVTYWLSISFCHLSKHKAANRMTPVLLSNLPISSVVLSLQIHVLMKWFSVNTNLATLDFIIKKSPTCLYRKGLFRRPFFV